MTIRPMRHCEPILLAEQLTLWARGHADVTGPVEPKSSTGLGVSLSFLQAPSMVSQLASSGKDFYHERTTVQGVRWHGWGKPKADASLLAITDCLRKTRDGAWKCTTYRSQAFGWAERIRTYTCTVDGNCRTVRLYTSFSFSAGKHGWSFDLSGGLDPAFADLGCTR